MNSVKKGDAFLNLEYFLPFDIPKKRTQFPFIFNVQKIKEVIEVEKYNPLPPVYHPFVAMYDLRGTPLPLLSLEFLLGDGKWTKEEAVEACARDWRGYRIIVLDVQSHLIGIMAGWVGRILDPKSISYLPAPSSMSGRKPGIINGLIKQGNDLYYMLDIEYVLTELNGGIVEKSKLTGELSLHFKGRRVLVAEDSRLFQKKAAQLFEKLGFEVVVAEDGEIALRMMREKPEQFDLIFTDIEMPNRNGISFVQEMRKIDRAREIPVIFNSSLSNEGLINDIKRQGLGDYIIKYDEKAIADVLERLSAQGRLKAA